MHFAPKEYLSRTLFTSFLIFVVQLPVLAFLVSLFFGSFLFGFLLSVTVSMVTTATSFFVLINYPRFAISSKAKKLDGNLPFATLYLSTIADSGLPLDQVFDIFVKFSPYEGVTQRINTIN